VNNLITRVRFPLRLRRRVVRGVALFVAVVLVAATPASATTIERVVSPGGIEAWLVHEPAVPLIAMDFAFSGGAAQDAPGKGGTATLVASLLDEGAGEFDSKAFHDRLERNAIEKIATKRSRTCGFRLALRALTLPMSRSSGDKSFRCCGAPRPARMKSPLNAGGKLHFPAIPTAVR
jgi:hypothetical protein